MKKIFSFICSLAAFAAISQAQTITNRYAMKLDANPDGTYSLQKRDRYEKLVDLSKIDDLLVPYTHQNDKLTGKLYNKVETTEYVYKHHNGYDLVLYVDQAVSDAPTPWVVYCHGGGWARGNADAGRSFTKYLAQQHKITGVRVEYSLAPQEGANVEVSLQDVLDAVKYIQDNAEKFNVKPNCIGFAGASAGAHLAACAAMKCQDVKVFVGYSGIYDLTTAVICNKTRDEERIRYFKGNVGSDSKGRVKPEYDEAVLRAFSPAYLINKKHPVAAQLYCGTADITVECTQSQEFASALQRVKGNKVELLVYPYYDHNLSAKASDKMEEIFFKSVDFIVENLK